MYKLMLVDDEYFVRVGMRETVDWAALGVEYIGDAATGKAGFEMACKLQPDIIITDIRMPGMDGLELIDHCKNAGLQSQYIVMSAHNEFDYAKGALQRGACDYVLKPVSDSLLVQAIKKAIGLIEKEKDAEKNRQTATRYQTEMADYTLLKIAMNPSYSEQEIKERLERASVQFLTDEHFVIFIRIKDYHMLLKNRTRDELKNFSAALDDAVEKSLATLDKDSWRSLSGENSNRIIFVSNPKNELTVAALKKEMYDLCASLGNRFEDIHIAVGISAKQQSVGEIAQGYTQSYMAAYLNSVAQQNSVNCFSLESEGYRWEIVAALNYISVHYAEDISIDDIASELFISPSHLMHLFRDEMGKTINECITEHRMQTAQLMLRNSNYNISEISDKIGYKNAKYFTRVFKKYTNFTPSEFARKSQ